MRILEAMDNGCQGCRDQIHQEGLADKDEAVAVRITTISGYVVITNDVVMSSLNAVNSSGHVIVVITTKVHVAEKNSSHVIPKRSNALPVVKNSRYVKISKLTLV